MSGVELDNLPRGVQELRVGIRTINYTPESVLGGISLAFGIPPLEHEATKRLFRSVLASRQQPDGVLPAAYFDIGQESLLLSEPGDSGVKKHFFTNPDIIENRLRVIEEGSAVYREHYKDVAIESTEHIENTPEGWESLFGADLVVVQSMRKLNIVGNALKELHKKPDLFEEDDLAEKMQILADGTRSMLQEGRATPDISPTHNNVVLVEDTDGTLDVKIIDKSPFNVYPRDTPGSRMIRPSKPLYRRRAKQAYEHIEQALDNLA